MTGAANVLEELLLELGKPVDREQLRTVVREAKDAWPGEENAQWWHWIIESGRNIGLKCKVVDCTYHQLTGLARGGAPLVVYVEGSNPWRAIVQAKGRKMRLLAPGSDSTGSWQTYQSLREHLGNPDPSDLIRCVIVEPSITCSDPETAPHQEPTPLNRLWMLLRPESGDIYILSVYALVAGLLALATPIAVESLVNTVAFGRFLQPVVILALMLFAFLAFSAAIQVLQAYVAEIIQRRLFARVAADLSFRLPRVKAEAVDGKYLPELVNRFFDIVTVQKVVAMLLLDTLSLVLTTFIGMAVLAFYHPFLLGFDAVLLAMIAFIIFVLGRGAIRTSIQESKYKYQTAAWLEDLSRCTTAFKFDGGVEYAMERADQLTVKYLNARRSHFRILLRQISFAVAMQAIASTVLLGLGGWLVISGQLTLGQLVAAEMIVTMIVGSFAKMGKHMESYYDLMAAMDKLGVLFDLPVEEQEGVLHGFHLGPSSVDLSDVHCGFSKGMVALKGINLHIDAGERVAFVGPRGSGKSVLLDLMFGLRTPKHGHIKIDGIDPRDLRLDVLRSHVFLVRGIEVFSGNVLENVKLGRADITSSDVRQTLAELGILDEVLRLPEGIETELSACGDPLSDKQLRCLMLARAIVARPGLLLVDGLLDEFADEEAEELIDYLCDPEHPWTLVFVTGRKMLAQHCERIYRLKSHVLETPDWSVRKNGRAGGDS